MFERHKKAHLFFEQKALTIEKHKTSFRGLYKKKIRDLSLSQRKHKQNQILKQLNKLTFWSEAEFIAGYKALKEEPSLEPFYKVWKSKICYPLVKKERLEFYKQSGSWNKNSLSVLEPLAKEKNKIPLDKISVFLIPGLAFDRKGGRLGRGKAYYDRTLAVFNANSSHKLKTLFIGIAFVEQVCNESLPLLEHDILLDVLVTDQFVLTPLRKKKESQSIQKKRKKL